MGHLYIAGCKMSKSLKNFVTVRELLRTQCDAETFRLFVLLHKYHSSVDYSEGIVRRCCQAGCDSVRTLRCCTNAETARHGTPPDRSLDHPSPPSPTGTRTPPRLPPPAL